MSLISLYRRFATTAVHRIEKGAIPGDHDGRVIVCIDELDKIVDVSAMRDFLRRVKAIFEVPGVYYYVSMSEDALSALYLGSILGKNEVDSSFDHVVRVEPFSVEEGAELTLDYFKRRGVEVVDHQLPLVIAAVAAGVPRDILRRCDEVVAFGLSREDGRTVAGILRRSEVALAYENQTVSVTEKVALVDSDPRSVSERVMAIAAPEVADPSNNEKHLAAMARFQTLALIEIASKEGRVDLLEELAGLGYRIGLSPTVDVLADLSEVHQSLFTRDTEVEDAEDE